LDDFLLLTPTLNPPLLEARLNENPAAAAVDAAASDVGKLALLPLLPLPPKEKPLLDAGAAAVNGDVAGAVEVVDVDGAPNPKDGPVEVEDGAPVLGVEAPKVNVEEDELVVAAAAGVDESENAGDDEVADLESTLVLVAPNEGAGVAPKLNPELLDELDAAIDEEDEEEDEDDVERKEGTVNDDEVPLVLAAANDANGLVVGIDGTEKGFVHDDAGFGSFFFSSASPSSSSPLLSAPPFNSS